MGFVPMRGHCAPYFKTDREATALFKTPGESLAVDILHYEIICVVLVADIMQYTNVRMIQAGDGLCLALEALLPDRSEENCG